MCTSCTASSRRPPAPRWPSPTTGWRSPRWPAMRISAARNSIPNVRAWSVRASWPISSKTILDPEKMILIPSIDLRNGRCVRLLKGNFDQETRYDLEPHELLQRYRALGATWLNVVDLDGAKDGRLANRSVIIRLASQKALHIQVGGGVRSTAVVDDLLRNGIDRVIVGSAAVENPAEVQGWLKRYGAEKIGLA